MASSTNAGNRGVTSRLVAARARSAARAAVLTCWLVALPLQSASAQSANAAQAEALFVEGKKLLDQKQYDRACPKLEASHRLDPATSTLLALAFCHEQQGPDADETTLSIPSKAAIIGNGGHAYGLLRRESYGVGTWYQFVVCVPP